MSGITHQLHNHSRYDNETTLLVISFVLYIYLSKPIARPSNMENKTEDVLGQLNSRLAMILRPNTIMLFIYMVLGLLGNSAVVYIYKFRYRQTSKNRFFIPYLAGIDAFASVICSSANIIINLNPVLYTNPILCKSFFMLSQFAASSSALMLTIIAVHRFQLICRPFRPQMTVRTKRLCVFGMLLVIFLLSIPSLFTTGIVQVTNSSLNVTGYVCASVNVMGSRIFPFVYNMFVFSICLGNLFLLCILYVMIGKTIYGRVRYRRSMKLKPICNSSSDVLSETCLGKTSTVSEPQSLTTPSIPHGKTSTVSESQSAATPSISLGKTSTISESQSSVMASKPQLKSARKMRTAGNRLSVMFLVVTLVYILCFMPTLIAMVQSSLDANDWKGKSSFERVGLRTANTLYIVNNIVNPIIYGFFDKTLQREIILWVSNLC